MIPQYLPLGKAAKRLGISPTTLRRDLERFCGLVFPTLGKGRSPLVAESDLQTVIEKRSGKRDWSRARKRVA